MHRSASSLTLPPPRSLRVVVRCSHFDLYNATLSKSTAIKIHESKSCDELKRSAMAAMELSPDVAATCRLRVLSGIKRVRSAVVEARPLAGFGGSGDPQRQSGER